MNTLLQKTGFPLHREYLLILMEERILFHEWSKEV